MFLYVLAPHEHGFHLIAENIPEHSLSSLRVISLPNFKPLRTCWLTAGMRLFRQPQFLAALLNKPKPHGFRVCGEDLNVRLMVSFFFESLVSSAHQTIKRSTKQRRW